MSSVNNPAIDTVSVNGQMGASVSPADRGLAYGDGVFETLRVRDGMVPLWQYHRERLISGCQRLGIPLDASLMELWVNELLTAHKQDGQLHATLKIIVTRGAGGRGYGIDPHMPPTVVCQLHSALPLTDHSTALYLCQQPLARSTMLAGLKHLNRLENVLLKAECQQAGFDDGLVTDSQFIIETVSSNVFFERDGELYTPELNECGVAGVMRRFILEELAHESGIKVHVEPIHKDQLHSFSSAICCNSLRGIVVVEKVMINRDRALVNFSDSKTIHRLLSSLKASRFCI
ncbi:aminodeoxychorismate lyase [Aestuariicella sp. G3-2]|uniref:aminodeoxychorismate lyase n=1 Tax=Pseudomaricurvus albidus TaxID=2842452 RepID=UPI001C0B5988|nr:aminodeoxychorismate lyase [Aestuariicella albida]MBU3070452.1 aminodeoxychorismate lyase [Aestuariicella albida]